MKSSLATRLKKVLSVGASILSEIDASELYRGEKGIKWSSKEILGHLVDSAIVNHQRIARSVIEDTLVFQGYDQDKFVALQKYQDYHWPDLILLWKLINQNIVNLIINIGPSMLKKEFERHSLDHISFVPVKSSTPATLNYLCHDYIEHIIHHLRQICSHQNIEISELENA